VGIREPLVFMLTDQYKRTINYLRLSVTDKCNLRCFYCMPEEGIPFWKKDQVLSYKELLRVCGLLTANGVDKIRITGGEPFVRKDLDYFLTQLAGLESRPEISITTNATLIGKYIPLLKSLGIKKINVSLDSLNEARFLAITRRNTFQEVYQNLEELIREGFTVKVNCVVMEGQNEEDLIPLAELTKERAVSVRFLEEMPFNGQEGEQAVLKWNHSSIKKSLVEHFGAMEKLADSLSSTSQNYQVKGYKGSIGLIPAFSRTFCGSCNRIRISANGDFRTCLYGPAVANLRKQFRQGFSDAEVLANIQQAIARKPKNGFIAEQENKETTKESMAHLGG
jgi:molybdenum cofactor biosynthesis protein A